MKKHFKTLKKFIATLLATILYSSIAPNTFLPPDAINTLSEEERGNTGKYPRS